jgi:hypothetical protein
MLREWEKPCFLTPSFICGNDGAYQRGCTRRCSLIVLLLKSGKNLSEVSSLRI